MFEDLFSRGGQWTWVAFAWAQLFVTYGGYQLYLRRRTKKLERAGAEA